MIVLSGMICSQWVLIDKTIIVLRNILDTQLKMLNLTRIPLILVIGRALELLPELLCNNVLLYKLQF